MSKTDKTRPTWVRMGDAPMVYCVPVHDHRDGVCTLPESIDADSSWSRRRRGDCYWTPTMFFLFGRGGSDGCRDCTGYHFRRADRRRSRHEARRELRDYRGER